MSRSRPDAHRHADLSQWGCGTVDGDGYCPACGSDAFENRGDTTVICQHCGRDYPRARIATIEQRRGEDG